MMSDTFRINKDITIIAWEENSNNKYNQVAFVVNANDEDEEEYATAKANYRNRLSVNENYMYQKVLYKAIRNTPIKYLNYKQKKEAKLRIQKKLFYPSIVFKKPVSVKKSKTGARKHKRRSPRKRAKQ